MSTKCIGIILDGNRRFAKAKGLPTFEGHRRGLEKIKDIMGWARKASVPFVVAYAFSTENWNRAQEEVSYLMGLFREMLTLKLADFKKEGFCIRCIGDLTRFSPELQTLMRKAEKETANLPGPTLVLALSYGGRAEILQAVSRAAKDGKVGITENEFSSYLWSTGIPDPDIIIRTGGDKRLSGFLTWQSVYSELFFVDTLLPDFRESEFQSILTEFKGRERRMGK